MSDDRNDLASRAIDEITGMAKDGLAHPSTRPVLTAAAVGAVAGLVLPVVSLPFGALVGAGFGLWQRIRK